MKTRKTKKGNSIRRIVAFLLCMTMVLGLGMQDVMEQVYAEEGPATVQQNVQDTEDKGNGEQDSASEDPNETPSPTEEGDKAPENTPAPESETVSETPSDSETPGQPADGQGSENGTGDGNTGNTGSNENSGNTGNTGNAGNTEQNNNQNTGNTSDGTQESENGNTGSGNEDKTPAADDAENSDGTKDPNGNGAPTADGVQGVKPAVPGDEDGTGSETADTTEETDETKVSEENVTELTYAAEDGSFSVTATALGEDADLSGYELHAAQLQKDGEDADRFAAAEELINGALEAENRETEALQVYDVWFTVAETGEETDLSGQVEISIEYTAPEFPEEMETKTEVFCLNNGSAEAAENADALTAGCDLYAVAWVAADEYVTYETTVDGVKIIVKANPGVIPEGAALSAEKIESAETEKEIKEAVAEDIIENKTTIQDMMVFDIKFLAADGQEVQPQGAVIVEFENTGYEAENGISVYHVDDKNTTATDMEATTETEADVAFETTHFSQYVVINQGKQEAIVTIEHYLDRRNEKPIMLYRTQIVTASPEERIRWSDYNNDE